MNQPVPAESIRSDVRRNRLRIVQATADVLAIRPGAGMSEIAEAAGLNRATLYRHFSTREALVGAIRSAVYDELRGHYDQLPLDGPALSPIADLVQPFTLLGNRYRVLLTTGPAITDDPAVEFAVAQPLLACVERGQRQGEIDTSLAPAIVAATFTYAIVSAVLVSSHGAVSVEEAAAQARRVFIKAVATDPAPFLEDHR